MPVAVYSGIFLCELGRVNAMRFMYRYAGPPLDNIYAHHLTLKFRPSNEEMSDLDVGKFAGIKVVGWSANPKAQALVCKVEEKCSNAVPHITISTAIGISPKYSNELIATDGYNLINPNDLVELVGVVGYFDGSRVIK